ncbi:metal ABC transporter ATP-binding protein [Paenibacillus turpanensis]|uniref:metal ABC transporter ATP-binding protein n=1 Tax=Paenibacillus turpanensis TaxID=2689078 RepID=UPI00140E56F3|nr:metal ABC transporter ATP-binding protein [Paenibacillus turpanensis]
MNQHCHEPVLSLRGVRYAYEHKTILDGLDAEVLERDFVGIIGSNGAGKTTLLKLIVGLLKPNAGEIRLFGEPIHKFTQWHRIGYVPQKNALNPLFPATVREVVLSGLYGKRNLFRRLTDQDKKKGEEALRALHIEDLAERRIGQLSGGQQQRVFLARALINQPDLLILDEPTVGVDAETQESFFQLIRHMHQHHRMTFLMVSHDVEMMKSYLGDKPKQSFGKLNFYVQHTHEPENCGETDLTHSLQAVPAAGVGR